MEFIILDLEWNNVYHKKEQRFINEILQIGAVRLDACFNVVDSIEINVRSALTNKLSNKVIRLTGLTNEIMLSGVSLADLLRRPAVSYAHLAALDPARPVLTGAEALSVEVQVKYQGYIARQLAEVARHERLESKPLSPDLDYKAITGLRIEAAQKLNDQKPLTVGQASRISGVSPADISVLLIYLGIH